MPMTLRERMHMIKRPENTKRSGEENLPFPEDVVEKILARIPLPSLFKVRLLSRIWSAKLPMIRLNSAWDSCLSTTSYDANPPPGMEDAFEGFAARGWFGGIPLTPFQKEVMSVSTNWTTYIPVFFTGKGLKGFDRVSCQWKSLFPLSYLLPRTSWDSSTVISNSLGPLMLVTSTPSDCYEGGEGANYHEKWTLRVVNVVTRNWRDLTKHCTEDFSFGFRKRVPVFARLLPGEFHTCRVLVVFRVEGYDEKLEAIADWQDSEVTFIYNPTTKSRRWQYSDDLEGIKSFSSSSVYIRGKVYCICAGWKRVDPWTLCIHRVDPDGVDIDSVKSDSVDSDDDSVDSDGTWVTVPLNLKSSSGIVAAGVLLCGQRIMVVTWGSYMHSEGREEIESVSGNTNFTLPVIYIYEFDLESWDLVNERKGPPASMLGVGLYKAKLGVGPSKEYIRFASDEDCIYFSQITPGIPVMTYNVHSGEWGCLPSACSLFGSMDNESDDKNAEIAIMLESCFMPGMNPFVDV